MLKLAASTSDDVFFFSPLRVSSRRSLVQGVRRLPETLLHPKVILGRSAVPNCELPMMLAYCTMPNRREC